MDNPQSWIDEERERTSLEKKRSTTPASKAVCTSKEERNGENKSGGKRTVDMTLMSSYDLQHSFCSTKQFSLAAYTSLWGRMYRKRGFYLELKKIISLRNK